MISSGKRSSGTLSAALLLLNVAFLLTIAPAADRSDVKDLRGKPAIPFSESSVNSFSQSLSACKGKVVLLDFWATWCGPCRKEMPTVKRISQKFKGKDLVIIGISLDINRAALTKYIRENGIDWPIVFDGRGWENRVAVKYGVHSIPQTVLIDRAGIIREVGLRGEELERSVSRMLEAPPAGK